MIHLSEARALFLQFEGKPCVFFEDSCGEETGHPYLARVERLHATELGVEGRFVWLPPLPPEEKRYEGFSTVWSAVALSPDFIQIADEKEYWLVFNSDLVRRAGGDGDWVSDFLESVGR